MIVRRLNRHGLSILLDLYGASLVAQVGKSLPAMQETWVQSLGQKDPLEKEMATRSSFLAWRIPWTEELGGPSSMGSQRIGYMTEQLTHYLTSSSPKPFLCYCTSAERLKSHLAERTQGGLWSVPNLRTQSTGWCGGFSLTASYSVRLWSPKEGGSGFQHKASNQTSSRSGMGEWWHFCRLDQRSKQLDRDT